LSHFKFIAVAALSLSASISSYASTYDIPSPLSTSVQSLAARVANGGCFSDTFRFTMDQSGVTQFSAVPELGKTNRGGLHISIFDSANNLLVAGSRSVFGSLDAGSYYATVSGFFKTRDSGYNVSALTAPVPLPAAIWSLGMGIAGFWFVGRRKQSAVSAA
jgi:hypothetical protein